MFRRSTAYESAEVIIYDQQLMDRQASLEARLPTLIATAPVEPFPIGRKPVRPTQLFHSFRARRLSNGAEKARPANQALR